MQRYSPQLHARTLSLPAAGWGLLALLTAAILAGCQTQTAVEAVDQPSGEAPATASTDLESRNVQAKAETGAPTAEESPELADGEPVANKARNAERRALSDEAALKSLAAGNWVDQLDPFLESLSQPKADKLQPLRVAALGVHHRRTYFASSYSPLLDANQVAQVEGIVDSHDWAYQDLVQRRHQILERYRDEETVRKLLTYNLAGMLAVNSKIRTDIFRAVLTPAQRTEYQSRFVPKSEQAPPPAPGEQPTDKSNVPMP